MTSEEVKNKVRDKVEGAFDQLHKAADVITFPLAPVDGAIHGAARGVINWLTDTHPQVGCHPSGPPAPRPNNGGGGCPDPKVPAAPNNCGKVISVEGNEIANNKGDTTGISNFANSTGGPAVAVKNNKIQGNEGKTTGITNFGNSN